MQPFLLMCDFQFRYSYQVKSKIKYGKSYFRVISTMVSTLSILSLGTSTNKPNLFC